MEKYLPPGEISTFDPDEYICDICPNPECHREKKFNWNMEKEVGNCFVCGFWINNWDSLKFHFRNVEFGYVNVAERKPVVHTKCSSNWLCNAWDNEKSRKFLTNRRVTELQARKYGFMYNPEENRMYVDITSISPDLPKCFLSRKLVVDSKWYVKKATQGIYYGWGWEKFAKSKKNVLLCEGIFDLVSTGLQDKGIALLRSDLNDVWFLWLKKNVNKVTLWFDADKAGDKAINKLSDKCIFYGIPFSTIKTKKDPKKYDRSIPSDRKLLEAIEEIIEHNAQPNFRRYLNR